LLRKSKISSLSIPRKIRRGQKNLPRQRPHALSRCLRSGGRCSQALLTSLGLMDAHCIMARCN